MNTRHARSPARWCMLLGAGMLCSGALLAQSAPAASPEQVYQRDRELCRAAGTEAERKNCLREAGAALQATRQGNLGTGIDAQQRTANALSRCEAHKNEDDRQACQRLARGEGTQSGSVQEGAVVREIVTRTVGPAPATSPAASVPPAPTR